MTTREYFNAVLNAHISEEMDAVSAEFIQRLDAKNAKRRSTESKEKRETSARRQAVLDFLANHAGTAFSRDEIAAACEIKPTQASAACSPLVEDGTINKAIAKIDSRRVTVYTYPVEE